MVVDRIIAARNRRHGGHGKAWGNGNSLEAEWGFGNGFINYLKEISLQFPTLVARI